MSIAIIGAGIAGAACAAVLTAQGKQVEKSRGQVLLFVFDVLANALISKLWWYYPSKQSGFSGDLKNCIATPLNSN